MPKKIDVVGQVFTRWTVLRDSDRRDGYGNRYVWCHCECGTEVEVLVYMLRSGKSSSCGCLHSDIMTTHGMYGTSTYRAWTAMKDRCCNENYHSYEGYGGRGITVCDAWLHSFETFLEDMGERPDGLSLDRKDNDGNYCKDNCRWATASQQQRNTRRNRRLSFEGQTKTVVEWAEETGISSLAIRKRLDKYGWTLEEALTTPVQ